MPKIASSVCTRVEICRYVCIYVRVHVHILAHRHMPLYLCMCARMQVCVQCMWCVHTHASVPLNPFEGGTSGVRRRGCELGKDSWKRIAAGISAVQRQSAFKFGTLSFSSLVITGHFQTLALMTVLSVHDDPAG